MSTLKDELGLSLSRIRVEYFGVPKHRDIFQQILADKVNGGGVVTLPLLSEITGKCK